MKTVSPADLDTPLRQLPSALSLPQLLPQFAQQTRGVVLGEPELTAYLKLDPLSVVRGLRAANAAIFREVSSLPTVRGVVRSLGATLSKRLLLQVPATTPPHAAELTELWRHAIATAISAEELAARTGLLEPETAYLLGLLHDLPEWLAWLDTSGGAPHSPTDWVLQWQLPSPFVSLLLAVRMGDPPRSPEDPADPASLIRAAELLAEMAGYRHPDASEDDKLIEHILRPEHNSEQRLVDEIRRRTEQVTQPLEQRADDHDSNSDEPPLSLPADPTSKVEEVILSVLAGTRSESYRGIVTVLTSSAIRHGNYDRAFYAKWNKQSQTLTIRQKADSSARKLVRHRIRVDENEADQLNQAIATERPIHLRANKPATESLLAMLGTDELIAVPLNTDFEQPAFLLLDHSLTLRPIAPEHDLTFGTMLGMTGSLLIQNLLLRRRRQRAQKFALTDPLTRLFNRRMGILALEQAIARTNREAHPLTVLMCDLDHFKRLNDTLGHLQGDAALKATADVLRHSLRKADTVCRYGGEEFLVVLPDTTPDEATVLATRTFTAVHARGEELGLPITISIGLTSYREGDTIEALLHRADRALYASKGYGRNRFSADVEYQEEPPANGPNDAGPRPNAPETGR